MDLDEILSVISRNIFAQVTFSGGDPLCQPEAFTALARRIKSEAEKNIWCYTGFTFEKIKRTPVLAAILPHIDVLVDGPFIEKLKDTSLSFRGSHNQRIIDVKESLEKQAVVLHKLKF